MLKRYAFAAVMLCSTFTCSALTPAELDSDIRDGFQFTYDHLIAYLSYFIRSQDEVDTLRDAPTTAAFKLQVLSLIDRCREMWAREPSVRPTFEYDDVICQTHTLSRLLHGYYIRPETRDLDKVVLAKIVSFLNAQAGGK